VLANKNADGVEPKNDPPSTIILELPSMKKQASPIRGGAGGPSPATKPFGIDDVGDVAKTDSGPDTERSGKCDKCDYTTENRAIKIDSGLCGQCLLLLDDENIIDLNAVCENEYENDVEIVELPSRNEDDDVEEVISKNQSLIKEACVLFGKAAFNSVFTFLGHEYARTKVCIFNPYLNVTFILINV
jgi:hypothetical protein